MDIEQQPESGEGAAGEPRQGPEPENPVPARLALWVLLLYAAGLVLLVMEDMLSHAFY